jgi:hypothetical protein
MRLTHTCTLRPRRSYLRRADPPRGPEKAVVVSYGSTGFTVFVPGLGVTSRLFLDDIGKAGEC